MGKWVPDNLAQPPFVSVMRKGASPPSHACGWVYSEREDHAGAVLNDIRYSSCVPRSFMIHTTSACAATNSAAGVSLSPRGRKANGRLHLSEWLSIIGERETGSRPSCEANCPMTDRRSPNADCGCQSIAGGVKGLTDGDCEKICYMVSR